MRESWMIPVPAFEPVPARDGLEITEIVGRSIAMIVARGGAETALRERVQQSYGLALPEGPACAATAGTAFLGMGPGRWLAVRDKGAAGEPFGSLADVAAVIEQSGAYAVVSITGSRASRTLARAVPIDLDPRSFPVGRVASTLIEHMGMTIVATDADRPAFEIYVARSLAGSFAHWLATFDA